RAPHDPTVAELEQRVRRDLAVLVAAGLSPDEASLIALKRAGAFDAPTREFACLYARRLCGQGNATRRERDRSGHREPWVVVGLAVAAALAVKTPELFGIRLEGHEGFYLRNASLFVFPLLVGYFVWKHGLAASKTTGMALVFAAAAFLANAFPFRRGGDTEVLTGLHLPIALWLAAGYAYAGGRWFGNGGRMEFVRFSGELAISYALMALGGGVFSAFTVMMFGSIGLKAEWLVRDWVVPCGAAGAFIVAAWLGETRRSVVGSLAPLMARLFTPLFAALLLAFLATMAWTGQGIRIEREILIAYDLLLALVVGLVLYAVSARDPEAPAGIFDGLQVLLVLSALVIDVLALAAIAARISGFGFTPNRVAALGENLILLANLAGSAWWYVRFLLGKSPYAALERWQIAYLPVYAGWAAFVVIAFPPLFDFR
ncbi:MAG: hypothetical protein NZ554_06020, partial [Bryobacteraceae bacterium]|nr:hypothetical protein [Bryobacteraceae bacterium]